MHPWMKSICDSSYQTVLGFKMLIIEALLKLWAFTVCLLVNPIKSSPHTSFGVNMTRVVRNEANKEPLLKRINATEYEEGLPLLSNGTNSFAPRINVVKEIPTLDVGPLDLMSVEITSTAVLKCSHQSLIPQDKVRLILWYRNDTSRPFLSFDARRAAADEDYRGQFSSPLNTTANEVSFSSGWETEKFRTRESSSSYDFRDEAESRISSDADGESLILNPVAAGDNAEYRCKVHYKTSPSFTYRLQLIVVDRLHQMTLLNNSNLPIGNHIGPYNDGDRLSLSCKVILDCNFQNLEWIFNGKSLPSSLQRNEGTLFLMLDLTLRQEHVNSVLFCRLTCEKLRGKGKVIREKTTRVLMFYIPRAKLLWNVNTTEGFQKWETTSRRNTNVEITESKKIAFVCKVQARPPPYSISWLRNGHHITYSKYVDITNDSLTMHKVKRTDDGLYTCLASNSEGDGQSNAVLLRVNYSPRCAIVRESPLIVPRNISMSLECNFEAEPNNVTFTWHRIKVEKEKSSLKNGLNGHGGVITGDVPSTSPSPKFIDLTPEKENILDENSIEVPILEGEPLTHQKDPQVLTRSYLRITPETNPDGYACFAKNLVGHSKFPCVFHLGVIDPPTPPERCKVEATGKSFLKVKCKTVPLKEIILHSEQSPDISPVRALETRTTTMLEVWALGTLVANISSDRNLWKVEGLTPDTDFRLRIYTTSLNAHSIPVVLYSRTSNMYGVSPPILSETDIVNHNNEQELWESESNINSWIFLGVGLGIVSFIILLILLWIFIISIIRKRKSRCQEQTSSPKKGLNTNWSNPSSSSQPTVVPSPQIQLNDNPSTGVKLDVSVT